MVLATLFLREPITWLKAGRCLPGMRRSAALILVLSRHGTGTHRGVKGDVLCIVSAISFATYLTAFRKRNRKLLARNDDEMDVPFRRHRRRGDLLPAADRGRLLQAWPPGPGPESVTVVVGATFFSS